jgi:hypothetical protein
MNLDEYLSLLKSTDTQIAPNRIKEIFGRILRGTKPSDFETLSDDPDRKIILVSAEDGLKRFIGKTGYQMLLSIGYEKDYIQYRLKNGYIFKLVVFNKQKSVKPATWDNVAKIVKETYPLIKDKIDKNLKTLKTNSFWDIEKPAGFSFKLTSRKGPTDPQFMNYERLQKAEGNTWQVRQFLYNVVYLTELFKGDGYTYDEQGNRILKEFLAPNCRITDFKDYRIVDLDVKVD